MEHFSWKLLLCVFFFIAGTHGFFMDNPCDIDPMYTYVGIPNSDYVFTNEVPVSCHNGTVDWNYPQGHFMMHFQNPNGTLTSICIRNWLGGEVFVYTDVTDGGHHPLGVIVSDHYTCTTKSNSVDIVLKIDAPKSLRYMGGFNYLVRRHT